MFASVTTSDVVIGEYTVKVRKLSYSQLAKALDARQIAAAKMVTQLGPDMMKIFREQAAGAKSDDKPKSRADVYGNYDVMTVLKYGIVSWSAPVKLEDGIEDLDEAAVEKIARAIIDISVVQDHADDVVPKG